MLFYIITPAFNDLERLRACVRSVADQAGEGVEVHHHVQDGGSSDGTAAWLEAWQHAHEDAVGYALTYESTADAGLYDALNKAWDRMPQKAAYTAHLNADEQYLPGALRRIAAAFAEHPGAELLTTTYLMCNEDGTYHCHRRPVQPHVWTSVLTCELMTCVCFLRADALRRLGLRFDISYRSLADVPFYRDLVAAGTCIVSLPRLVTSMYTLTGRNLSWTPLTATERARYNAAAPAWQRLLYPFSRRWVNFKRRLVDLMCPAPQTCALYHGDAETRTTETITVPTCICRRKSNG
ncbi:MAG: glycosyltransferase [Akkermansia sp.]|nr:glycosyltransferase [Akkermansia sp.]